MILSIRDHLSVFNLPLLTNPRFIQPPNRSQLLFRSNLQKIYFLLSSFPLASHYSPSVLSPFWQTGVCHNIKQDSQGTINNPQSEISFEIQLWNIKLLEVYVWLCVLFIQGAVLTAPPSLMCWDTTKIRTSGRRGATWTHREPSTEHL